MQRSRLALTGLFMLLLPACLQEGDPSGFQVETGEFFNDAEQLQVRELNAPAGQAQSTCGNSVQEQGETCDDGNQLSNDGCSKACQDEWCGDGVTQQGVEECDPGQVGLNAVGCDWDCTLPECGDSILNPFTSDEEECDDGNNVSNDGCGPTCQVEKCGDGVVQQVEACDAGKMNKDYNKVCDPNACNKTCSGPPASCCGDGVIDNNHGEACDAVMNSDQYGSLCNSTCSGPGPYCGDGMVNDPEVCDYNYPGCNQDCSGLKPCNLPALICYSCWGCGQIKCPLEWEACYLDIACSNYAGCISSLSEAECMMFFPAKPLAFAPLQQCLQGPACQEFCGMPNP